MKKFIKLVIIVAIVLVAGYFGWPYVKKYIQSEDDHPKGTASNEIVKQTLERASELTAGKLRLTGVLQYDDQGIPILTNGKFSMEYEAEVRAGIDVSKINIDNVDNTNMVITVTLPKAEILGAEVDPNSLKFFDKSFTLFDLKKQEDVAKAQAQAKDDIIQKAADSGLLELADKQSEDLIRGILTTGFPDYTIEFNAQTNQ